jgi:hypothetical protein
MARLARAFFWLCPNRVRTLIVRVRKDMPAAENTHPNFHFQINGLSVSASAANHLDAHSYGPLALDC